MTEHELNVTIHNVLCREFYDGGGNLRYVSEFVSYDDARDLLENDKLSPEGIYEEALARELYEEV